MGDEYADDFEADTCDAPPAAPPPGAAFETIDFASLRIGRTRGGGAFAIVSEAVWSPSSRAVAVKQLADAGARDDLLSELRALCAAGRHPNVVELIGASLGARPALVLELLGPSLAEGGLTKRASLAAALGWAADVAAAVAHLHARTPTPVLHRDIKTANVLLRARADGGAAVLCDFGLAGSRARTAGTPAYLAPELFGAGAGTGAGVGAAAAGAGEDGGFSRAADVYALGATMYSILTGDEPWRGDSIADIRSAVLRGERPPMFRLRADVSGDVRDLIVCAMAQAPDDRPSAAAIAQALAAAAARARKTAATATAAPVDALDALGVAVSRRK
jgi:serine/threonine protein kinase